MSEWMTHGNIMEFIKVNHDVNRLELVRGFTSSPVLSLKRGNSCTGQLEVWGTYTARRLFTEI